MASRIQVKAIVEAAMVASGFRPRSAGAGYDMPHRHNDCLVDGLYTAFESFHFKAFYNPTGGLPGSPGIDDVYVASATANGWTKDFIYAWNGAVWEPSAPVEGMFVWIDNEDEFYKYNGVAWSMFTATVGAHYHDALVAPGTEESRFYIDADGGHVFVGADGTKFKRVVSTTGVKNFKWDGLVWVDLHDGLYF